MKTQSLHHGFVAGICMLVGIGFGSCMERTQPSVATAVEATSSSSNPVNFRAATGMLDFADLAEKVGPAVVNVFTTTIVRERGMTPYFDPNDLPEPFRDFFRQFTPPGNGQPQPEQKAQSLGSGFIISADGIVLTNNHVIDGADEILVQLNDQKKYEAKLLGRDEKTDLAILQIETKERLPFLEFGDSDKARVGQWVIAVGNPFGLNHTVTSGIISAKGRVIGVDLPYQDFIQTDASINPGNSGGPMINMAGQVIGVNTAIFSRTGQSAGVGFAIPSNLVKFVTDQLVATKKVVRGYLGVLIQPVDESIAASLGLAEPKGALVTKVMVDSPAGKAGVEVGDLIIEFNQEPINEVRELPLKVSTLSPGTKTKVKVLRRGKEKLLTLELAELPDADDAASSAIAPEKTAETKSILGMHVRPLTKGEQQAADLDESTGLFIEAIDRSSAALEAGVLPGDIIIQANTQNVANLEGLKEVVKAATKQNKKSILLLLRRGGQNRFVGVKLED